MGSLITGGGIPMKAFNCSFSESEIAPVRQILRKGELGFGKNVEVFESKFSQYSNKRHNIGLSSASAAAYCLFAYLYKKHGSCDVYTPSIGFASPVQAAIKNGHRVHFIDVDENLLADFDSYRNIRLWHLERQLNVDFNKSVFMPILYGGTSDIGGLIQKVRDTNWGDIVVVDSAHCLRPTIESDYIFFSFHPLKPLAMSNGGILATESDEANEYIRRYRNFGREHIDDSYDIVDMGFNFYMNNLNATLGLSKIETCFKDIETKKRNFEYLKSRIDPSVGYFTTHDSNSSYYLATLILESKSSKGLRRKLRENGAIASFHYPLLHKTTMFHTGGAVLPNSEKLEDRIINLPIHQDLTKENLRVIIEIINS